jgi:dUTP pyrophosphatase
LNPFKDGGVLQANGTYNGGVSRPAEQILVNHGATPFIISRGMKIAQLVVAAYARIEWKESSTLETTTRGLGGFGSTGVGA